MVNMTPPGDKTDNTSILNDILLDLQVEVGRTKVKISDVMNLEEGSIIPLNQHLKEPLTIYINNKAIAKGQIISADGKYSIRIL